MKRFEYFFIGFVIYLAVGISALMSAHYGYVLAGEGSEEYERYILAGAFGIFDIIIAILAADATSKRFTQFTSRILFIILFALSSLSGAAYMLGKQAEGQGGRVALIQSEIETLDKQIAQLDPVKRPGNLRELRKAREKAYSRLQAITEEQGGEVTKANAIFIYLSKEVGIDADSLAALTRLLAMFSLNLSGVVLAAWRNQKNQFAYGPIDTNSFVYSKTQNTVHKPTLMSTRETDQIKKAILSGEVRPSVTQVAKHFTSNNRAKAEEHLIALEQIGVLKNRGQGKRREIL